MDWRKTLLDFYRATFHLHHWLMTERSLDYWEEMRKTQWLTTEELTQLQLEKLEKLLKHAYENVPYYRKLFKKHGIKPQHIQTLEDLQKIPLLDKETVKREADRSLLASNVDFNKLLKIRTSGSTGMPLHIYADVYQLDMRYAAVLRCWEWTGWRFGDKSIRLWHQTIGMTEEQVKKEWLDAFLMRREFLPVFEMDDKNLMKYVLKIKEYKPKLMDGYAEAFDILANFIRINEIDDVFVPAVVTSAQMLSDKMRENITKYMHTEVFDRYGCREFSTIAHECEKHIGYHVNAENLIVEIIKNNQQAQSGEIGEVVITDLNNYSQPLIRYRLGDLAKRITGKCPCGRGLPLIGKIYGRTKGVILGLNGRYLTTAFFLHYLKEFDDEIRKFQIIQEKADFIIIKIIPENKTKGISTRTKKKIVEDFKKFLGSNMQIEFELTGKIEMIKTGKHLSVISKLNFDFQNI